MSRRSSRQAKQRASITPGPEEDYRYLFSERGRVQGVSECYQLKDNIYRRQLLPQGGVPLLPVKEPCRCLYVPGNTCGEDCANRLERFECCPETCPHPMCSNRRIQHGDFPEVTVEYHPTKGRILKLAQAVPAGTLLGTYAGEVLGEKERKRREQLHGYSALSYTMNFMSEPMLCIDANREGSLLRYCSHQCGQGTALVHHWQLGGRRHIVFEAARDLPADTEVTFNYFAFETNREAKRRQFDAWGRCRCGSKDCESDALIRGVGQGAPTDSASTPALILQQPMVDVLGQLPHLPRRTPIVQGRNDGDTIWAKDDIDERRGLTAWSGTSFLAGDFIAPLVASFAKYSHAGYSTFPATEACPYWITWTVRSINETIFCNNEYIESMARSPEFEGLLNSATGTKAIFYLNVKWTHWFLCEIDMSANCIRILDSCPRLTDAQAPNWRRNLVNLLDVLRAKRYPGMHEAWQWFYEDMEQQSASTNDCLVFSIWSMYARVWRLCNCTNRHAAILRLHWIPFILWAEGGTDTQIPSRDDPSGSGCLPSDEVTRQQVQLFYQLLQGEVQPHAHTDTNVAVDLAKWCEGATQLRSWSTVANMQAALDTLSGSFREENVWVPPIHEVEEALEKDRISEGWNAAIRGKTMVVGGNSTRARRGVVCILCGPRYIDDGCV